jgi:hypothetical protein
MKRLGGSKKRPPKEGLRNRPERRFLKSRSYITRLCFPASYCLFGRSESESSVQQAGPVVAPGFQERHVHSGPQSCPFLRLAATLPPAQTCRKKFLDNPAPSPLFFAPRKSIEHFLPYGPERPWDQHPVDLLDLVSKVYEKQRSET